MRWGRNRIAALIGLAVFFVMTASIGAVAGWIAPNQTTTGSVTAASTSLTLAGPSTLSTTYAATGAQTVIKPFLISNTGQTPLTYALSVSSLAGRPLAAATTLTLWAPGGTTCASIIPSSGTTSGTLAAPPATMPSGAAAPFASGASFTLCVATTVTTSATTQGEVVNPTVTITGKVGNWTSTDSGSFVQSVPLTVVCDTVQMLLYTNAKLSWTVPNGTGPFSYRVVKSSAPTVAVPSSGGFVTAGTTVSITYQWSDFGGVTTTNSLIVQASTDGFATFASSPIQLVTSNPGLAGIASFAKCG